MKRYKISKKKYRPVSFMNTKILSKVLANKIQNEYFKNYNKVEKIKNKNYDKVEVTPEQDGLILENINVIHELAY